MTLEHKKVLTKGQYQKMKYEELEDLAKGKVFVMGTGKKPSPRDFRRVLKKDIVNALLKYDIETQKKKEKKEQTSAIENVSIDFQHTNEIYGKILEYIQYTEKKSTSPVRIYFAAFETSDTDFMKQSNNFEIGVLARTPFGANVLLGLLSPIIDGNPSAIADDIAFYANKEDEGIDFMSVKDATKVLADYYNDAVTPNAFDISGTYTRTLMGGKMNKKTKKIERVETVITKEMEDVNIYSIQRINNEYWW